VPTSKGRRKGRRKGKEGDGKGKGRKERGGEGGKKKDALPPVPCSLPLFCPQAESLASPMLLSNKSGSIKERIQTIDNYMYVAWAKNWTDVLKVCIAALFSIRT